MSNQTKTQASKPNEIDKAVGTALKKWGIKASCISTQVGADKDGWECDKWVYIFNDQSFEYNTGIGHRSYKANKRAELEECGLVAGTTTYATTGLKGYPYKSSSYAKPVLANTPTPASVLYCLLLDAQSGDESFNDWCDNFGYDNDSISAFNTYQACCEIEKKLGAIISRPQLEELRELLEEY